MPTQYKYDPADAYREAEKRIANVAREHTTFLDLGGLGLTSVPPEIGALTAINYLSLSPNQLTLLPPEIGGAQGAVGTLPIA